jgi:hypothetical protein
MKTITCVLNTVVVSATMLGASGALGQTSSAYKSATANNSASAHKTASATANGNLSVRTENGQTVVTFNGRQIYSGPALKGQATSRSSNVNGVAYEAVYDGDRLLWENVPGAAQHVPPGQNSVGGADGRQLTQQHQETVRRMQEEQRRFMETHSSGQTESGSSSTRNSQSQTSSQLQTARPAQRSGPSQTSSQSSSGANARASQP